MLEFIRGLPILFAVIFWRNAFEMAGATFLLKPPIQYLCNQLVVDGPACTTVCGPKGGVCDGGACYCYCDSVVFETLTNLTTTGGVPAPQLPLNCTPSLNQTRNDYCNTKFCAPYGKSGTSCRLTGSLTLPGLSVPDDQSEVCTCNCGTAPIFQDGNNIPQLCSYPGIQSGICQSMCGVFGGHCNRGFCWCRCPPSANGQQIITTSTSCDPSLRITGTAMAQACENNTEGIYTCELCSAIPPTCPFLLPLIPTYQTLVDQTTICTCHYTNATANQCNSLLG